MNAIHQEIVDRLPEYRALTAESVPHGPLYGLPKEALVATVRDLAGSLVALITTPDSEAIQFEERGFGC